MNTAKDSEVDALFKAKSLKHESKRAASARTEEIESNSDSSGDDDLMVQYGAKRISSHRRMPRSHTKTTSTSKNEEALEKLGAGFKKRPLSLSKGSKAKRARRRTSDSSSDDSDELTIVCHLCNEKIPKELYDKHAEEELVERERARRVVKATEESKKPLYVGVFDYPGI